MAIKTTLQLRRDTFANWTNVNPILANGEVALVDYDGLDGHKWRIVIGDGTTDFNHLTQIDYLTNERGDEIEGKAVGALDLLETKQDVLSANGILSCDGEGNVTSADMSIYAKLNSSASFVGLVVNDGLTANGSNYINGYVSEYDLGEALSPISSELSNKVKLDGTPVASVNISRVNAETYHNILTGGSMAANTVYVVSSDNINAFGERVVNVGDAVESGDAVNLQTLNNAISTAVEGITNDLSAYQVSLSALGRDGDTFKYQIKQGLTEVGQIEVPYDVFVDGGRVEKIDDKTYLLLTLNNATSTVLSIEATDLVDVYTPDNAALSSGGTVDVSISNYKISAGVIDGSITAAKLSSDSVTTAKIVDGAVTNGKIAASAVGTTQLSAEAVTPDKMSTTQVFVFDCGGASA